MPFERVLVATDFSEDSREAARMAWSLAAPDAEMRVLHVYSLPPVPMLGESHRPVARKLLAAREAEARDALDAFVRELDVPGATSRFSFGSVAREVSALADEMDADLVAMGTRGQSRLAQFLLGSKARAMLRAVPRTLLLARRGEGDASPLPIERIAVATDFYEPAEKAGARALAIARSIGAGLHAFHAVDPSLWGSALSLPSDVAAPTGAARPDVAWLEGAMSEMLHRFNEETLEGAARESLSVGFPVEETARFARKERIDLLVVGTHGPGAVERLLVGSVAEGLADRSPCSVLVVRDP